MVAHVPQLRTPGIIAAELGVPLARVLYVLLHRVVRPIGRAGVLRLYDQAAVDAMRAEIQAIDERKGARR